jgi:hypothetical protein
MVIIMSGANAIITLRRRLEPGQFEAGGKFRPA